MTGKISEDPDKVIDGTEKLAATSGGQNYGPLVSSIATYLASATQTLTSKVINAASNTITNLTTAMFAANVIDTDVTLAANSDTRIASQKATKGYVDARRLDQAAAPTADVSLNSHKLTSVTDPTSAQDAATKAYVDNVAAGLDVKPSVKAATTANITLSAAQTIDGVALVAGDRCLVKNQSTPAQNGIYVVAAGAWSRATDMDAWAEVPGASAWVEQGTTLFDTAWVATADQGGTLGTTAIAWTQFGGAGAFMAAGTRLDQITAPTADVSLNSHKLTSVADPTNAQDAATKNYLETTLGLTTTAWTAYTPSVSIAGSTLVAATALGGYKKIGRLVICRMKVSFSSGSATGLTKLQVGLPVNCVGGVVGNGAGYNGGTSKQLNLMLGLDAVSTATVSYYDGSAPVTNQTDILWMTGFYESAT